MHPQKQQDGEIQIVWKQFRGGKPTKSSIRSRLHTVLLHSMRFSSSCCLSSHCTEPAGNKNQSNKSAEPLVILLLMHYILFNPEQFYSIRNQMQNTFTGACVWQSTATTEQDDHSPSHRHRGESPPLGPGASKEERGGGKWGQTAQREKDRGREGAEERQHPIKREKRGNKGRREASTAERIWKEWKEKRKKPLDILWIVHSYS